MFAAFSDSPLKSPNAPDKYPIPATNPAMAATAKNIGAVKTAKEALRIFVATVKAVVAIVAPLFTVVSAATATVLDAVATAFASVATVSATFAVAIDFIASTTTAFNRWKSLALSAIVDSP